MTKAQRIAGEIRLHLESVVNGRLSEEGITLPLSDLDSFIAAKLKAEYGPVEEAARDIAEPNYTYVCGECQVPYRKIQNLRKALDGQIKERT